MKATFILAFVLISSGCFAQNYLEQYHDLLKKNEREKILPLLQSWKKAAPDDPEMFIGYFNYYLQESKTEMLGMGDKPGEGDNLTIRDTATNEPVGYMYNSAVYDDSLFDLAQDYINRGIDKNPRRLDMHFGKIYSLQKAGRDSLAIEGILALFQLNEKYKEDGWLWSENQPLENAHNRIKGAVQDYIFKFFNTENPPLNGIEKVSLEMMETYPDEPESYANIGICNLLQGNLQQALEWFLKAHEKKPDDIIVLNNIAYVYRELGKQDEAIKYFKMIIEQGSEGEAKDAQYQINQMKKENQKNK